MNRKTITNYCAVPTALFLLIIGILHAVLNVSGFQRAIERGEIPARLTDSALGNAAFSGTALSTLGLLVILLLPALRSGNRYAARAAIAMGMLVAAVGAGGFLMAPTKPSVLIFLFFGALLAIPLIIWRGEFRDQ